MRMYRPRASGSVGSRNTRRCAAQRLLRIVLAAACLPAFGGLAAPASASELAIDIARTSFDGTATLNFALRGTADSPRSMVHAILLPGTSCPITVREAWSLTSGQSFATGPSNQQSVGFRSGNPAGLNEGSSWVEVTGPFALQFGPDERKIPFAPRQGPNWIICAYLVNVRVGSLYKNDEPPELAAQVQLQVAPGSFDRAAYPSIAGDARRAVKVVVDDLNARKPAVVARAGRIQVSWAFRMAGRTTFTLRTLSRKVLARGSRAGRFVTSDDPNFSGHTKFSLNMTTVGRRILRSGRSTRVVVEVRFDPDLPAFAPVTARKGFAW